MSLNKFLLFGDSVTEYAYREKVPWIEGPFFTVGAALTNVYTRKLDVVQRGYSGYSTREGVKIIGHILHAEHDIQPPELQVRLAYVEFGTNDARLRGSSPYNHQTVPLQEYVANMLEIVEQFRSRDISVVAILPGLHDAATRNKFNEDDSRTGDIRTNENSKLYADSIAAKLDLIGVPYVHLYNVQSNYLAVHPDKTVQDLLIDGIHYSGISYRLFYDELLDLIKQHYPQLHPDSMAQKWPHHHDVIEETEFGY